MDQGASLFGVAGFMYEAEQLLGVPVDVIPISLLSEIDDQIFAASIQQGSVLL